MSTNHFLNISIKIIGIYFGVLALEYLIDFSVHYLPTSANRNEITDYFKEVEIKSNISKFILYLSLCSIALFKSQLIGSFFVKKETLEDESIDQNLKESRLRSEFKLSSVSLTGIKLIGIIFTVVSASNLISLIYSFTLYGKTESYDLYFFLGYFTGLITPLVQLILGIILMKTPEWLIRLLRLDSL